MSILQITRLELEKEGLGLLATEGKAGFLRLERTFKASLTDYSKGNLFALESVVDMLAIYCNYNYDYTAYVVKSLGVELNYNDVEVKMVYMNALLIEALFEHSIQVMDVSTGKSVVDEVIDYVIKGKKDEEFNVYQTITDLLIVRGWVDEAVTAQERARLRDEEAKEAVLGGTVEEFEKLSDEEKGITNDNDKDA